MTIYKNLLDQKAYFEECGNGNLIEFDVVNLEDNTVMLTLNGEFFKEVHLCEEIEKYDGLIQIGGRLCEAFVVTKLKV